MVKELKNQSVYLLGLVINQKEGNASYEICLYFRCKSAKTSSFS